MPAKKVTMRPAAAPRKAAAAKSAGDLPARTSEIVRYLARQYADATCALRYESPFQLLVATILSAQCTDERVNLVTAKLFAKYPNARRLAAAPLPTLEKAVQSTGFFRAKAKNIKACAEAVVRDHGGEVPADLETLVALPGVGRKTANVVLGTALGISSGVVVDTHVGRISRRLGLTMHSDPVKVEQELMTLVPRRQWIDFSHQMIHHGRRVCAARKPMCPECGLRELCPRIGV